MTQKTNLKGPRLATERLELSWLTHDDASLLLAVWNDPAFMRFVGDRGVRTLEEAELALAAGPMQLYAQHGYGPFKVTRSSDGVAMGVCGLFHRDGLSEPDIGFALLPEYCGQGYGFEASLAVLEHARDPLGLATVVAVVSEQNAASIALLEKLGLSSAGTIRLPGDDKDIRLYRIDFGG